MDKEDAGFTMTAPPSYSANGWMSTRLFLFTIE